MAAINSEQVDFLSQRIITPAGGGTHLAGSLDRADRGGAG